MLDVLQQYEPDILLLDLKMPELEATLQRLRAAKYKTRVIFLTAGDDKNEFVQAMRLGTSGIFLKQTATELLIECIRKVHAGEIWLDSRTTAAVIRQFVANDDAPAVQSLPPAPPNRKREIEALVAQGFKNKEAAEKTFIREHTPRFSGEGGSGTPVPAYASFRLEDCPTRTRKPGRNTDLKSRLQ